MKKLDDFLQSSNNPENIPEKDRNVLAKVDKEESIIESVDTDTDADIEAKAAKKEKFTFAHMADCHLGAFREEHLRELNLKAFEFAIDRCIERMVDFIVISGDLFHRSFPDLGIMKRAVEKMREAVERDIRIYLIYGSHDYTAGTTSLIDILGSAGLFKKVFIVDSEAKLSSVIDEETGAEIMGVSGRTQALESKYYSEIRAEPKGGFSIFLFHTAISELRPEYIPQEESIPLSLLPKNFNYYAGGHVHERIEYKNIFYPGPLFGSDFRDLSALEERGFFIVDVDGTKIEPEFVSIKVADFDLMNMDFTGMDGKEASELLLQRCKRNFGKKVLLLNLHGRLKSGSVADIDINGAKREALKNGADFVAVSRSVTSEEKTTIITSGSTREEIEKKLFSDLFGNDRDRARALFSELSIDQEDLGMSRNDFEKEVEKRGFMFFMGEQ